jgi:hypothetical protein
MFAVGELQFDPINCVVGHFRKWPIRVISSAAIDVRLRGGKADKASCLYAATPASSKGRPVAFISRAMR